MQDVVEQQQWKKDLTSFNGKSASPAAMEKPVDQL